ncbi:MAG: hypothetical protein PHS49_01155 [Candidatus Gracilibacteria bacterium]|nr:hypothetical protein [Candidatus Gracilibacteria bacterium]
MIKKLFIISILLLSNSYTFASAPEVNCVGLPGCVDSNIMNPGTPNISNNIGLELITSIIGQLIQYVAVIAVIALIISGFFYLFSGGEEEKTKKAKTWIIWSLVGVLVSISAWGIINMLNNFYIY